MITEQDLSQTSICLNYELFPVKNVIGDLSGLLGTFLGDLVGSFYPRNIGKKSNIVVTELLNNAIHNMEDINSKIVVQFEIDKRHICIIVKNSAKIDQYEKVRDHVDMINSSENLNGLLARTIRARRSEKRRGGLGLIRLATENRFDLTVDYENPYLIMKSEFIIGEV